jgi:hypothetical protein
MKHIVLNVLGVRIDVTLVPVSDTNDAKFIGEISSNLKDRQSETDAADDEVWDACVDGIESLILGHACAGVNIESQEYIEGLTTAIEAVQNNLG